MFGFFAKAKRPDVSICLLTWNRASFLDICLKNLFGAITPTEHGGLKREIIIMDNASTDKTVEVLKKYESCPGVRIIRNKKNYRMNAYKRLFFHARGRVMIDLDDDVLSFPKDFDKILVDYLDTYRDYGFLALNVVQNELTNGSRPPDDQYTEDRRGDFTVLEGPTGGWCSAIRQRDYRWLKIPIFLWNISMRLPEDALLCSLCLRLRKRMGVIKNAVCLHASGPVYARMYNQLDREIEKYSEGGVQELASVYRNEKEVQG